jgi:hypothetical protein
MATKRNAEAEEASVLTTPQEQESVYTAEQLAGAHDAVFGVRREIVVVALRLAGKNEATVSEARTIIENFKNKEVK